MGKKVKGTFLFESEDESLALAAFIKVLTSEQ